MGSIDSVVAALPPLRLVGTCVSVLVIYVCVKRRPQEIGGWLLYYYIQLYIGVMGAVISFFLTFDPFLPGSWDSAPDEYPWFIISTLLGQLALPAQLAVAEKLRFSRDARWLQWLRAFLWVDLALSVTETGIDSRFFPDALLLDALSILWPAIWIPYFYFSKRVKRVFKISEGDMAAVQ